MFEDALMESGGRIRTQRGWFSGVAAICNGSIVCLLMVWPLLHPASLPRQTLSMLLAAPAPPEAPLSHALRAASAASRTTDLVNPYTPTISVPTGIKAAQDEAAPEFDTGLNPLGGVSGNANGVPSSIGNAAMPAVRVAAQPKLAISSGVMAGNKLSGADPLYPAIARAARIQGTVVLAATISKSGMIENLHVVSGPPLLVPAAESAVRSWRYRPYRLNGEPVEVETTVKIIFNLGG